MKIILPKNVFSFLIQDILPDELKQEIIYLPSAKIASETSGNNEVIGLIPTTDLLTHKDLFISSKWGVSFEESLCNSYLYFVPEQHSINKVYLYGDISSLEVLLTKILYKEAYGLDVEIHLASELADGITNLIISGDFNFSNGKFLSGLSLAEKLIEITSLPYVNYVFASGNSENLEKLDEILKGSELIYDNSEEKLGRYNFPEEAKENVLENLSSFIFKFEEQDKEGIQQLLRLPYYYGVVKEIIDIKFV